MSFAGLQCGWLEPSTILPSSAKQACCRPSALEPIGDFVLPLYLPLAISPGRGEPQRPSASSTLGERGGPPARKWQGDRQRQHLIDSSVCGRRSAVFPRAINNHRARVPFQPPDGAGTLGRTLITKGISQWQPRMKGLESGQRKGPQAKYRLTISGACGMPRRSCCARGAR
jgi:hypothetical protein